MRALFVLVLTAGVLAAPNVVAAQHRVNAAEGSVPLQSTSVAPFPGAAQVLIPFYEPHLMMLTSKRTHRLRNAAIGAVVGGAIGYAVGYYEVSRTQDWLALPSWFVYAPLGAVVGGFIGSRFR